MYIINPLMKKGAKLNSLSSTHPPVEDRIKILRFMTRGADLETYQKAYSRLQGKPVSLIPESGLEKNKQIDIREASPEEEGKSNKKTARDVMDLMRAVNEYAFLACVCGLKMKLPPEVAPDATIACPRCGRGNKIPIAEIAPMAAMVGAAVGEQLKPAPAGEGRPDARRSRTLEYTRKGKGWETFACECGRLLQLSPAFNGHMLGCKTCGRKVQIKLPE